MEKSKKKITLPDVAEYISGERDGRYYREVLSRRDMYPNEIDLLIKGLEAKLDEPAKPTTVMEPSEILVEAERIRRQIQLRVESLAFMHKMMQAKLKDFKPKGSEYVTQKSGQDHPSRQSLRKKLTFVAKGFDLPAQKKPFVSRMYLSGEGKIERYFYDHAESGYDESGKYWARWEINPKVGDVLDVFTVPGEMKEKRKYVLVTSNGIVPLRDFEDACRHIKGCMELRKKHHPDSGTENDKKHDERNQND